LAYVWRRLRQARAALTLPLAVWAMSLAHIGVGVFVLGAVGELGFKEERTAIIAPGEHVRFAGYDVHFQSVVPRQGPNYIADSATFVVGDTAKRAERRFYPDSAQTTTEVAILPSLGGDLYIALGEQARENATWTVRLYHNPLVDLIYVGAAMMALGGVVALTRLARRSRVVARTPALAQDESLKPAEAKG
jgi:cytochrome c-type biogenesis protein CcmF